MPRNRTLKAGLILAAAAAAGLSAYIAIGQITLPCPGSYAPAGYAVVVGSGSTEEFCFPHNTPFRLVVGFCAAGTPDESATGFIMASENDCYVSWVGQNGDGTTTAGCDRMGSGEVALRVGPVYVALKSNLAGGCAEMVGLDSSYPGHSLMIVNPGAGLAYVTLMY